MKRKLYYHRQENKIVEESRKKQKDKRIVYTYLNETHHGIKRTNLCRNVISPW